MNLLFGIPISQWGAHNSSIDIQRSEIILLTANYTHTNLVLRPKKPWRKSLFTSLLTSDVEENLYSLLAIVIKYGVLISEWSGLFYALLEVPWTK